MHYKEKQNHYKNVTCSISILKDKISNEDITNINITEIFKIFEFTDLYLQYFILTKNKTEKITINSFSAHKVGEMIRNVKKTTIIRYNQLDLDNTMIKWLKLNLSNFTNTKDIISILNELNLNQKDKNFFRQYFGYNIIYKEYKKLIDDASTENLQILLVLLDNNKICYNKLLEIYQKLNYYLENNILDKNFIFCCKFLYFLLEYDFKMFYEDYKEFLLGFSIYLFDLLYLQDTIRIFEIQDIKYIVKLIKIIYPIGSSKYKKGIYIKSLERLNTLFTNIYEDTIMLIFILEIFCMTDEFYASNDSLDLLHNQLEAFQLSPLFKTYKDYDFISLSFFKYKYKILNKLKVILEKSYDKLNVYNDLYHNDTNSCVILYHLNDTAFYGLLDNLIILINNSNDKIQYINILFDKLKEDDLSYLYLYLQAIKENHKHVLYFTIYFLQMHVTLHRNYFEMLILIYFNFIDENDVYICRTRIKILDFISKTDKIYIDIIIKEIKKYKNKNKNIFILIYFVIKSIKRISKEEFIFLYKYLLDDLEKSIKNNVKDLHKNKDSQKNNIKDLHKNKDSQKNTVTCSVGEDTFSYQVDTTKYRFKYFYYKLALDLLTIYDSTDKIELINFTNFHNYTIILLYYQKLNSGYDLIKQDLFKYVFLCSKKERKFLYKLIFIEKICENDQVNDKKTVTRIEKKYNI